MEPTGPDPLLGGVLNGRFRVVELVGLGGMSRVYRAVQEALNRSVAIKVLDVNRGLGRSAGLRQRFLVEAELTAKLSHPNTVRVLDYGCSTDGVLFIAMEYLDGRGLDTALKTDGPIPWRRVLHIGQQVARSLREAHNLGVVHRDLKPANVMLLHADDGDQVKVLDFGLVKSFVEGEELEGRVVTAQGVLVGSPGYMAPEQGEKNHADPRSDIYSLGAVLYEALTGAPPFTGMSAMEIILEHAHAPLPPMVAPGDGEPIPVEMEALVTRCLAKSPMDRFQSMDEVLDAMQELTTPDRFRTEPIGIPVVAALPAARPRRPLALLVAVAILLGATGAAATLRWLHPSAPASPRLAAAAAATPVDPPAAPGSGVVFHVETFPPGATVTLDGSVVGTTPLDVARPLAADGAAKATFELSLPGYQAISVSAWGRSGEVVVEESLHPVRPKKAIRRR